MTGRSGEGRNVVLSGGKARASPERAERWNALPLNALARAPRLSDSIQRFGGKSLYLDPGYISDVRREGRCAAVTG